MNNRLANNLNNIADERIRDLMEELLGEWDHERASELVSDPQCKTVIWQFVERLIAKIVAGEAARLEIEIIDGYYFIDFRYPHVPEVADLATEPFDQ